MEGKGEGDEVTEMEYLNFKSVNYVCYASLFKEFIVYFILTDHNCN